MNKSNNSNIIWLVSDKSELTIENLLSIEATIKKIITPKKSKKIFILPYNPGLSFRKFLNFINPYQKFREESENYVMIEANEKSLASIQSEFKSILVSNSNVNWRKDNLLRSSLIVVTNPKNIIASDTTGAEQVLCVAKDSTFTSLKFNQILLPLFHLDTSNHLFDQTLYFAKKRNFSITMYFKPNYDANPFDYSYLDHLDYVSFPDYNEFLKNEYLRKISHWTDKAKLAGVTLKTEFDGRKIPFTHAIVEKVENNFYDFVFLESETVGSFFWKKVAIKMAKNSCSPIYILSEEYQEENNVIKIKGSKTKLTEELLKKTG